MHDKYKRRLRTTKADARLRRQIATEAARRLLPVLRNDIDEEPREPTGPELATAKREAVTLLGRRVREGDLPGDSEVREQLLSLARQPERAVNPSEEPVQAAQRMADHIDRFAIYKMRLEPLHAIKMNPKTHPEGDALFHSLQVFERARDVRPYDEEFLLAALLHHVGLGVDSNNALDAALAVLEGTIGDRTRWLIEHLPEVLPRPGRPQPAKPPAALRAAPHFEDLELLRELDEAARVPGAVVCSVDEAVGYIRHLDRIEAHDDEALPDEPADLSNAGF